MGGERTSHVVPGSHSRMWAAASSASLRLLGWQAISMSMCSGACCSAAGCGCPGAAGQLSVFIRVCMSTTSLAEVLKFRYAE